MVCVRECVDSWVRKRRGVDSWVSRMRVGYSSVWSCAAGVVHKIMWNVDPSSILRYTLAGSFRMQTPLSSSDATVVSGIRAAGREGRGGARWRRV